MARLQDLLIDCHGAVDKIVKVDKDEFDKNSDGSVSYDEWLDVLRNERIKDSFYINGETKTKLINYIFYADFEKGVYVPLVIPTFSKSLVNFQILGDTAYSLKTTISLGEKQQERNIKENKWTHFYMSVPESFYLKDFNFRYKQIPDEYLLEVFQYVYSSLDYNCNYINKDILFKLKELKTKYLSDKEIIVYRGHGEYSPEINEVYSWTTSKKIAIKFALMRKTPCCLYKAKVKEKDVITKINDRNERELVILPENIYDLEMIDFDETNKDIATDIVIEYKDEYESYKKYFYALLSQGFSFSDASSCHALTHSARMLFYLLMLSDELGLSEVDKKILAYCCIHHDIGRTNDYEDKVHGRDSVNKTLKLKLYKNFKFKNDELDIANIIIECHSIDDEDGIDKIKKKFKSNKEQNHTIKLYKIFKDIDALDRVRFNGHDLDIKFFRNKNIKNKLLIASTLTNIQVEGLLF